MSRPSATREIFQKAFWHGLESRLVDPVLEKGLDGFAWIPRNNSWKVWGSHRSGISPHDHKKTLKRQCRQGFGALGNVFKAVGFSTGGGVLHSMSSGREAGPPRGARNVHADNVSSGFYVSPISGYPGFWVPQGTRKISSWEPQKYEMKKIARPTNSNPPLA